MRIKIDESMPEHVRVNVVEWITKQIDNARVQRRPRDVRRHKDVLELLLGTKASDND